jgi:putative restriction endonuclease
VCFLRLSFGVALGAAHIILWSKSSESERLDVRNGLLLCPVHHELFDAGVLTVDGNGTIHFQDPDRDRLDSDTDELMTSELDGDSIFVPERDRQRPSREALGWRERYALGARS